MTQEDFLAEASHPELVQAVIAQMNGWENFCERAQDITTLGIDAGFGGFTYNAETTGFALENYAEILSALHDDKQSYGNSSVVEMMSQWVSLKDLDQDLIAEAFYSKDSEHEDFIQVFNALAWYAAEKVSHDYIQFIEADC